MAPLPLLLATFAAMLPLLPVDDIAPPPGASSTIVLTTSTEDAGVRSANLHCEPSGGSHPNAPAACEELLRSNGHVHEVQDSDLLCTFEYRPVHVTAVGSWRGEQRNFDHVFPNACAMRVDTGWVFQF